METSQKREAWNKGKLVGQKARTITPMNDADEAAILGWLDRIGETDPVVDHIIPHEGSEALMWDESNWQPLCKPCHDSTKKAEEARGGGL